MGVLYLHSPLNVGKEGEQAATPDPAMVTPPQNNHESAGSPGITLTFPLDPGQSISHPQQAVLPLPTHSCYPVSNDLKLFPLSGLFLLVLEITPKISILPDSWPLPELPPSLFLQERALPRDRPSRASREL